MITAGHHLVYFMFKNTKKKKKKERKGKLKRIMNRLEFQIVTITRKVLYACMHVSLKQNSGLGNNLLITTLTHTVFEVKATS